MKTHGESAGWNDAIAACEKACRDLSSYQFSDDLERRSWNLGVFDCIAAICALFKKTTYLQVEAEVRYWEDAQINGIVDQTGDMMPLRTGDLWTPVIRLEDGFVEGWPSGKSADICYKVCDQGEYFLLNDARQRVAKYRSGYVPDMLSVGENGYGDYIILKISANGYINGWKEPSIDDSQWQAIAQEGGGS